MAKPELGTKRICPETGRKFYDLNKDPIVSPFTGATYPRSYFDSSVRSIVEDDSEAEDKEIEAEDDGIELVSLEEADEEAKGDDDLDLGDDEDDVDLGDDDDDTFLADDEEDEDDVSGMINVGDDDDEN